MFEDQIIINRKDAKMKNETKKKLQSLELGDLVIAIEEQENNIIYVDKTFDERMELFSFTV